MLNEKMSSYNKEVDENKRIKRSLRENITVLDIYCEITHNGKNIINAQISGNKKNIYFIKIKCCPQNKKIRYSCSCPDFIHRNDIICKHLYFFGKKYFNKTSPNYWKLDDLVNVIIKYSDYDIFPKGKNEKCPICLENINYNIENTINCMDECRNSVHGSCWYKYVFASYKYNCVMCRTELLDMLREF